MGLITDAIAELTRILQQADSLRDDYASALAQVLPANRKQAENLVDYLAFRSEDRSALQQTLAQLSLSSLGRSEASIRHQLERVRQILGLLQGEDRSLDTLLNEDPQEAGRRHLEKRTDSLFGAQEGKRFTRIMVTVSAELLTRTDVIDQLISGGMNVARINCAHDTPEDWKALSCLIRQRSIELGMPCRILMDLAGPKLRTGPMPTGHPVRKCRPQRDRLGRVLSPGLVNLYWSQPAGSDSPDSAIPLQLKSAPDFTVNSVEIRDARGKKRLLSVEQQHAAGLFVSHTSTVYFATGNKVTLIGKKKAVSGTVGDLPLTEEAIRLQEGDQLYLCQGDKPAQPAQLDENGQVLQAASVSCPAPEAFVNVEKGQRIRIDDGKFSGVILSRSPQRLLIRITSAPPGGARLKSEKGLNFPDSDLVVQGYTPKDRQDLRLAARLADLVSLSFIRTPEDVSAILKDLERLEKTEMGLILKIETRQAYEELPAILLTALQHPRVGVMIARGDLGVEAGWRRMAEIQEEILWLCAAAHIPAIWATQVLESMAKTGTPTRSEITDAAMAQRAECVMLNKGENIARTVRMLHRILTTMDQHQYKKSARLPALDCRMGLPAQQAIDPEQSAAGATKATADLLQD